MGNSGTIIKKILVLFFFVCKRLIFLKKELIFIAKHRFPFEKTKNIENSLFKNFIFPIILMFLNTSFFKV